MAVRINPCFRCPLRNGCELKAGLAAKVVGLGLRSASFPCAKLGAEMRRGRRVVVRHPVMEFHGSSYSSDDGYRIKHVEVPATVTTIRPGYRFSCTIDPRDDIEEIAESGKNVRFRRTMPHFRVVRFLDEPDGQFCQLGQLLRGGRCDSADGHCGCHQLKEAAA